MTRKLFNKGGILYVIFSVSFFQNKLHLSLILVALKTYVENVDNSLYSALHQSKSKRVTKDYDKNIM